LNTPFNRNEKDSMILEFNPKTNQNHIYFLGEEKLAYIPDWKNLGMFYGTMI